MVPLEVLAEEEAGALPWEPLPREVEVVVVVV